MSDATLTEEKYLRSFERLQLQFVFVRHAMTRLSKAQKRLLLNNERSEKLNDILQKDEWTRSMIRKHAPALADDPTISALADDVKKERSRDVRKEFSGRNIRFYDEFIHDSLNRSELLLLVAMFETFMAEFHRDLLYAAPEKAFGKKPSTKKDEPRKVELWKVFGTGYQNLKTSSFFDGLVVEEVRRLAHGKDKRATALKNQFGIDLTASLPLLRKLSEIRNHIAHDLRDDNPMTTISDQDLADARKVYRKVPVDCLRQAKKLFPGHFH